MAIVNPTFQFRRAYKISAYFLCGMTGLGFIVNLCLATPQYVMSAIGFALGLIILTPIILRGGFEANQRFALIISMILMILFVWVQVSMMISFSKALGEGPNGEGSPGANIIIMVFLGVCYTCPWILTFCRGVRSHRNLLREKAEASESIPR